MKTLPDIAKPVFYTTMETIQIDGIKYAIPRAVAELIVQISLERDTVLEYLTNKSVGFC